MIACMEKKRLTRIGDIFLERRVDVMGIVRWVWVRYEVTVVNSPGKSIEEWPVDDHLALIFESEFG